MTEVTSAIIEATGPLTAFANGSPFLEMADVRWSRRKPAPGPPGTYVYEDRFTIPGPTVEVRIVLHDDRPEVDEVKVTRQTGDPEISATWLRNIPLNEIVESGIEQISMLAFLLQKNRDEDDPGPVPAEAYGDEPWVVEPPEGLAEAQESALGKRRRRTVTDELLREVARVYLSDSTGAPTKAVADHFPTSHRNATRYVALARERGFLPPYGEDQQ